MATRENDVASSLTRCFAMGNNVFMLKCQTENHLFLFRLRKLSPNSVIIYKILRMK